MATTASTNDGALIQAAKQRIQAQLKDPRSADFRNVRVSHAPDGPRVCGEVNAKNALGGYVGFKRFIVLNGSPLNEDDVPEPLFTQVWQGACA